MDACVSGWDGWILALVHAALCLLLQHTHYSRRTHTNTTAARYAGVSLDPMHEPGAIAAAGQGTAPLPTALQSPLQAAQLGALQGPVIITGSEGCGAGGGLPPLHDHHVPTGFPAPDGTTHALDVQGTVRAHDFYKFSDGRLKSDIEDVDTEQQLRNLEKLRLTQYTQLQTGKNEVGVIAQELEQVLPDAVKEETGDTVLLPNGEEVQDPKTVNYNRILVETVGATQQLAKEGRKREEQVEAQLEEQWQAVSSQQMRLLQVEEEAFAKKHHADVEALAKRRTILSEQPSPPSSPCVVDEPARVQLPPPSAVTPARPLSATAPAPPPFAPTPVREAANELPSAGGESSTQQLPSRPVSDTVVMSSAHATEEPGAPNLRMKDAIAAGSVDISQ